MSTKLTALQLAILQAMQGKSPQRNALADLLNPARPQRNALADLFSESTQTKPMGLGMFAKSRPGSLGLGFGLPRTGARSVFGIGLATKTRHVFYSFHFADVFRVNQIRNCDQFRTTDKQSPRVVDRSLWERAQNTNPASLARMIDQGLEGTSTTCVLAGYGTWAREWVRYEIARSLERGNGLLTVSLSGCPCPRAGVAPRGPNPLDYVGLGSDLHVYEWGPGGWKPHGRVTSKLAAWPKWLRQPRFAEIVQLSQGAASFDWVADDGAHNLINWTDAAAAAAGK